MTGNRDRRPNNSDNVNTRTDHSVTDKTAKLADVLSLASIIPIESP